MALGFKASNLTNRGIVSHGPYSCVRHPAYIAKNLAWWIGALPDSLCRVFERQRAASPAIRCWPCAAGPTIYALRAITEERHLLLLDNGYAQYMQRVKWRFIPRVI